VVLGLHRQYCVEEGLEPHHLIMEIRTTSRPLPLNNPGCLELHYMELIATQYDTDVDRIDGKDCAISSVIHDAKTLQRKQNN